MDRESYGVKRSDLGEKFDDGDRCAICGTDEDELFEVSVIGEEEEFVVICDVCFAKHGQEIEEGSEEIEPPDNSDADGGMHEDMQ